MALDKNRLDPSGSGSKGTKIIGLYETPDTKATVKGAGYFNLAANELGRVSILLCICADATFFAKVVVAAGVVTISLPDVYT